MKALYKFLIRKKLSSARQMMKLRASIAGRAAIEAYQVKKFNEVWSDARQHISFYEKWQKRYSLPDSIESLNDLQDWPTLMKSDLRDLDAFVRNGRPIPTRYIMTGGSTGEPLRLPTWGDANDGASQIVGRWEYGVGPGCRTFLLWGHRHLYGTGWRCRINILKRCIKDYVADWKRVSAYDLGDDAMRNAYDAFAKFRPELVIGFSSAILSFCRRNKDQVGFVRSVRVVLCTAGPLTSDEKTEIADFFGAMVCMEYGSVECSVMAYTRPEDNQYSVFWNTHLLQAHRQQDNEYKNIVTLLSHSYVPLIRYDIGDCLDLGEQNTEFVNEAKRSVLRFKSVKGRPNEMLRFSCGVSFFGALIGDCAKQVPGVIATQIAVDEENDKLEIRLVADHLLCDKEKENVLNRFTLTVTNSERLHLSVVQLDNLKTTVGGKTMRIVRF